MRDQTRLERSGEGAERGRANGEARAGIARSSPCAFRPRRPGPLAALVLLGAVLAFAAPAGALTLPVEGGHTFALPLPGFAGGLEGVEVGTEGAPSLFFGLTEFPISGGAVEGPGGFFPFTGTFEHEGTALLFSRGESQVAFRDPVVDTATLGIRADVDVLSGIGPVDLGVQRVFDLLPLGLSGLPLPFPAGPGGFDPTLPAVFDAFGEQILLDLLLASFSLETELILSEALFGGDPLELAGTDAALLAVVAELGEPVPEPATALLVALAGLGAAVRRSRRPGA